MIRQFIRAGNIAQARQVAESRNDQRWGPMMLASIDNPSSENTAKLVQQGASEILADPDPETHYVVAQELLFCGQKELALKMLKTSIDAHYCAYDGLRNDSIWTKLKGAPEFTQLLAGAKNCRDEFMAQRAEVVR